jgi:hypothetical protein
MRFRAPWRKWNPAVPRVVAYTSASLRAPRLKKYLASPRRLAFNTNGIFRHYPELDEYVLGSVTNRPDDGNRLQSFHAVVIRESARLTNSPSRRQLIMAIELYWGSGSPFAWRVMLTLEVKGLLYESKLLEFSKGDHKTPPILQLNPRGKVPTLKDGDFVVYESLAIMSYLDRKYPATPLFGTTAEETG